MKAPKIPKGWRKLRRGSIIRDGDRYWDNLNRPHRWRGHWGVYLHSVGEKYSASLNGIGEQHQPRIRRAQPRRHAGKGK